MDIAAVIVGLIVGYFKFFQRLCKNDAIGLFVGWLFLAVLHVMITL